MAPDSQQAMDPGLAALVMMMQLQGVTADAAQIRHRIGTQTFGVPDMLRCAKDYGLKARAFTTNWSRLAQTPMPALAILKDGGYLLLGKVGDDKVLAQAPLEPRPRVLKRSDVTDWRPLTSDSRSPVPTWPPDADIGTQLSICDVSSF